MSCLGQAHRGAGQHEFMEQLCVVMVDWDHTNFCERAVMLEKAMAGIEDMPLMTLQKGCIVYVQKANSDWISGYVVAPQGHRESIVIPL